MSECDEEKTEFEKKIEFLIETREEVGDAVRDVIDERMEEYHEKFGFTDDCDGHVWQMVNIRPEICKKIMKKQIEFRREERESDEN